MCVYIYIYIYIYIFVCARARVCVCMHAFVVLLCTCVSCCCVPVYKKVWNLVREGSDEYDAIVQSMQLRESLRDYVLNLNQEAAETGAPMMRPMAIEFPYDKVCANNSAEQQYMLGSDWLIAPVVQPNVTTWNVYLPKLLPDSDDSAGGGGSGKGGTYVRDGSSGGNGGYEWVYWWNKTRVQGGQWVQIDTSRIADFPLFWRRPISD